MITIDTAPDTLSSVFDEIYFDVSSDKANPELRIKCEIQVYKDSAWSTIATKTVDKYQSGTFFRLYIHSNIKSAIEEVLPSMADEKKLTDSASLIQFRCVFTELVYDADELYTESDDLTTPNDYFATNLIIDYYKFEAIDHFITDGESKRFLTSRPEKTRTFIDQIETVSFIHDGSQVITPVITRT